MKKILPITSLAAVAVVPFTTTSCSKVWEDMFSTQYQVNFKAFESKEKTSAKPSEATQIYFDYFKDHTDQLIPDIYWGVSAYCREELDGMEDEGKYHVRNYLSYVDYCNIDATKKTMSFKLRSQIEVKHDAKTGKSYSVDTYNLVWQISNLEFKAYHYDDETRSMEGHEQIWAMCPVKYHIELGEEATWDELTGNEQIMFEFKTVKKGYGEDGSQNFVREIAESAIIDEQHKYVPQLSEVYTNSMLLETYYLSKLQAIPEN